jgi:hypothetical protein
MFKVDLPPDSSWKWSTGITTEDQNEIKRLEAQVAALREDLEDMFNVGPVCLECQRKDDRIKVLEKNLRILLSVKITDQDGNISLSTNEERYQIARKALEVKP